MDGSDGRSPVNYRKLFYWFAGALLAAFIASIVDDFWELLKTGSFFDFLESVSGEVENVHFIRTDLVDETKQAVAEWVLAISGLVSVVATFFTRQSDEGIGSSMLMGFAFGFALGSGLLFLLSGFDRFQDIHLAIGGTAITAGGIAIIFVITVGFLNRYLDKRG